MATEWQSVVTDGTEDGNRVSVEYREPDIDDPVGSLHVAFVTR